MFFLSHAKSTQWILGIRRVMGGTSVACVKVHIASGSTLQCLEQKPGASRGRCRRFTSTQVFCFVFSTCIPVNRFTLNLMRVREEIELRAGGGGWLGVVVSTMTSNLKGFTFRVYFNSWSKVASVSGEDD